MKGQLITLKATGEVVTKYYDAPIPLADYQAAVGGYIETVPGLETYKDQPCKAFCNEEGKLNGLPFNHTATQAWDTATNDAYDDILVGNVVIVTGDPEFLEAV